MQSILFSSYKYDQVRILNLNYICKSQNISFSKCGTTDNGNRILTNTLYFIIRTLATMSLASVFIMLDAQTIQMCKIEEANGKSGSYGRQILYKTLAQAIISPLVLLKYINCSTR